LIDREYFSDMSFLFNKLSSWFWPGPLTMVVKSNKSNISNILTANTGYVGLRIPKHPIALDLTLDFPIAAPSANKFGHVSPTSA
jgi:tRNA A37 threonylcarbamoyladenosine synthetase subunit TsaC/SUA5/YrdC